MSPGIFLILLIIFLSLPLDSTGLYLKGFIKYTFHVYLVGKSQKYRYLQNKKIKSFDIRSLRQEGDITCTECANSLTRGMDYRIARSRNFIRMAKRIEKKLEIVEKKANKTGEIENTNFILRKILFGVNLNQTNPK